MWLIFAVSQAPIVVLFSYVYFRDRVEKEPLIVLAQVFFLGAFICLPAGFIEVYLEVPTSAEGVSPISLFFSTLFGIALVEEGLKYVVLRYYAFKRSAFNEPYDGIMYGVAASLGFAALENFFYVLAYGVGVAYVRMFTAVPMHAATGVLMGYQAGRAKFAADPGERSMLLLRGFAMAVVFHGVYNYFLFMQSPLLVAVSLIVLGYQLFLSHRAISEYANAPPKTVLAQVTVPPPPPEARSETPPLLNRAVRPLQIGAALSFVACTFYLIYHLLILTAVLAVLSLVLFFTARGLTRASRISWLLALGVYVVICGTPGFVLGFIGLSGLLNPAAREFFWGPR